MGNSNQKWSVIALYAVCMALTVCLLGSLFLSSRKSGGSADSQTVNLQIVDRLSMNITNQVSDALEGVLSIPKTYWLSDDDQVAPEPDPACYGTTDDPSTLQWLMEEAEELLDGQETYFSTETQILPGTAVNYYLDPTIFAVTWKEEIGGMTYTLSEIKIAHASQFRRFLSGGKYGSDLQLTTSEMAASVNAVVASAGDFYKFRHQGVIVYNGAVKRADGRQVDTCLVDENGNLIFARTGEVKTEADAVMLTEENNIRFSLAFGPILIENGERCEPNYYPLGEIEGSYSRAGIGQRGELHYILTVVNSEFFHRLPSIAQFAASVEQLGCDQFYALDGGQTATIVMNDQVINDVDYGAERKISDIIYFATAIPDGG